MKKEEVIKEFKKIPNVGSSIADDLYRLGYRKLSDLKNKNPEKIYADFEKLEGTHVDRCMLYVFRSLVYMAKYQQYRKEDVVWWNFKETAIIKNKNNKGSRYYKYSKF